MGDDKKTTTIRYGFQATVWVAIELEVKPCSYDDAECFADTLKGVEMDNNSDTMWIRVEECEFPGLVSASVDLHLNDSLGGAMDLEVEDALDDDDAEDRWEKLEKLEGADNG
tara:strand:+ start:191 stop:526 length:336 start_codon:yes stop_codon:yes gene_type:complete